MTIAPPEFHLARHARLRENLRAESLDALIVTSLPNIAYLTGLFASAGAVVLAHDRVVLIVDGRYAATAKARQRQLPGAIDVVTLPGSGSYDEAVATVVGTFANVRVGFDDSYMTVRQHRDLQPPPRLPHLRFERRCPR